MSFFILCGYISFLILPFLGAVYLYKKMTLDQLYKLTIKNSLKNTQNNEYFCSHTIYQTLKFLIKKREKKIISKFIFGRFESAIFALNKKDKKDLAASLIAYSNPNKAIYELEYLIKESPQNMFILGELAKLYFLTNNFEKLTLAVNNFKNIKTSRYVKSRFAYLEAMLDLRNGNMLSVSENLEKASKGFRRTKAYVEEARCYMFLGISYKAVAIFDAAQFIFETALKIYKDLNYEIGICEVLGNLGSLMSTQKRFEEAFDYFEKALKCRIPQKNKAYIFNQIGLNYLLEENFLKAEEYINKSLKTNSQKDIQAEAFSFEILSIINYENKNYSNVIETSTKAIDIYDKIKNVSAYLESKYIKSLALFESNDLENAEKESNEIINICLKEKNSFHVANCYNLLGLIYIKNKNFKKAKGMFKESINLEQSNDRLKEVATDYFNISITENMLGDIYNANKSLEIAMVFAEEAGEKELIEIIKSKLKSLEG